MSVGKVRERWRRGERQGTTVFAMIASRYVTVVPFQLHLRWGVWRNSHGKWKRSRKWGSDSKWGSDVWSEKGLI